jgi:hypothetical protein
MCNCDNKQSFQWFGRRVIFADPNDWLIDFISPQVSQDFLYLLALSSFGIEWEFLSVSANKQIHLLGAQTSRVRVNQAPAPTQGTMLFLCVCVCVCGQKTFF